MIIGAAALFALSACGEQSQPEPDEKIASSEKEWTADDKSEAEAAFPLVALPAGAPPAPVTGACFNRMCEANKIQFSRQDWPKAWLGDYQGQRNAAFCRSTGCDGAVETNKVEACAWRSVILAAHVGKTNDTDTQNLKTDCGALDEAESVVASGTAKQISAKIYGNESPRVRK